MAAGMHSVLGCDFSSAPHARKPVVLAWGAWDGGAGVHLQALEAFAHLTDWQQRLAQPPRQPWVGGFDLPFGLLRPLVQALDWPTDWAACMNHYACLPRAEIRQLFAAYCHARPAGSKLAHRATDGPAGASPSMKWVNPPVAFMLHAGVPLLRAAGVHLPGLAQGDPQRVALEAYPGLLAREVLGRRSYKSDDRARQTPERAQARSALLAALEAGHTRLGLRLVLDAAQRQALLADAQGDRLDAVLCMLQAAWGARAHAQGAGCYGLPSDLDPLEGWILTA